MANMSSWEKARKLVSKWGIYDKGMVKEAYFERKSGQNYKEVYICGYFNAIYLRLLL